MPIFDQGYQHWKGRLSGHVWRWLAITRHGIRVQLKGRYVRLLMTLAWMPTLALVAALAVWGLLEQGTLGLESFMKTILPTGITADPHAYRQSMWTLAYSYFFKTEILFIMLLVTLTGPGLISRDLRFNALPLYFSRPLTRLDYFLGKLGVIGALVAAVAVLPAAAAYVLGVCFSLDLGVVRDTWRLLPASILYGLVIVASVGTLILALSSLSRRSLYVGIAWIGLWLIGSAVAFVLGMIQEQSFRYDIMRDEMARANAELPPQSQRGQHGQFPRNLDWQRMNERVQKALTETARTNWRPLFSYTANLERLGEGLLKTDAAWVQIGRATAAPQAELRAMFGSSRPGAGMHFDSEPANERFLADQYVPQYPWTWSAAVLAGLLGISLWTLSVRVKSLDRLR